MKLLLYFTIAFISIKGFSHNLGVDSNTNKLKSFIHIWGVVKYMHPSASRGDFDMNQEFIKQYYQIQSTTDQTSFENQMLEWIAQFDRKNSKYKPNLKESEENYVDYNWTKQLGAPLQEKLNLMINNKNTGNHYAKVRSLTSYVAFKDESKDFLFDKDSISHQLLFTASYWNAMQYWNVNITLNDEKWNHVLDKILPLFNSKENNKTFAEIKDRLLAYMNDSHSDNLDISTIATRLKYFPTFGSKIINDSLVITEIRDLLKTKKDTIELGDIIFKIEGMSIGEYINKNFNISSSNPNYTRGRIERLLLLASDTTFLNISILKKQSGLVVEQPIQLYKPEDHDFSQAVSLASEDSKPIEKQKKSFGYINLGSMNRKELKEAINTFKDRKALIVDLRNYPSSLSIKDIDKYFIPNKKLFLKLLAPSGAGKRIIEKDNFLSLFVQSPFIVGGNKRNAYQGAIVLLIDRHTGSHAEHLALAIQQNDKTYTIGEQTMGAVMNTNIYTMLNGEPFVFTNYMAIDPSSNDILQRNGIKSNLYIKESAKNYQPDYYLKEAIEYINDQQ